MQKERARKDVVSSRMKKRLVLAKAAFCFFGPFQTKRSSSAHHRNCKMGGIFSIISKLIWGDSSAQVQPQMNVGQNAADEMEELVAQVGDLKHGEYVR